MAENAVAPTSDGQSHVNTLRIHTVKVCFSTCPGRRDKGVDGLRYKVFDADPQTSGGKLVASGTTVKGVVEIPWRPNPPVPSAGDAMFVEILDTIYRVTLRGAFEPAPATGGGLTPTEMTAATGGFSAPPNAKLRAVQQRLDLLGYTQGFIDNEGKAGAIQAAPLSGRHDAGTEQAILAFQQDQVTPPNFALNAGIHGLPDDATVAALALRTQSEGYP